MTDSATPSFDDERGSEVDDYTGEIPVVHIDDAVADSSGITGFGDGDVADVDDAEPDDDALSLTEMMDLLVAERDEFKDLALRTQADFENYRKRSSAQLADEIDRATGRLAEALLPVLDAAEAAFVRHPDEIGPLLNSMLSELKKQGLTAIDLEGQPFDPEVADAVAHEQGEGGEPVVAEVLRTGYQWKGKTLRAAMVRTED